MEGKVNNNTKQGKPSFIMKNETEVEFKGYDSGDGSGNKSAKVPDTKNKNTNQTNTHSQPRNKNVRTVVTVDKDDVAIDGQGYDDATNQQMPNSKFFALSYNNLNQMRPKLADACLVGSWAQKTRRTATRVRAFLTMTSARRESCK